MFSNILFLFGDIILRLRSVIYLHCIYFQFAYYWYPSVISFYFLHYSCFIFHAFWNQFCVVHFSLIVLMCMFDNCSIIMGVARIFQRGGHTESYRGYSSDCHLNIVGCFLIKRLSKGGSHAPQDPPGYALGHSHFPSVSPSIVTCLA